MIQKILFRNFLLINCLGIVFFILDRLSKWLAINNPLLEDYFIIPNILAIKFHENFGVAFSLKIPEMVIYILVMAILLVLIFLLIRSYNQGDSFLVFALTIIILGALSNLIDRFLYGYVVDFIDVPFFTVFNLADVMIVGGVGIWLISLFIPRTNKLIN